MIALIASALLGLYAFLPGFLFSRLAAPFIELKRSQRSKTEEIIIGIAAAGLPFICALVVTHYTYLGQWPWPVSGSVADKLADYRTVFTVAYSEGYFSAHQAEAWQAISRASLHQLRFLVWNYAFLGLEIGVVTLATLKYGDWRENPAYRLIFGRFIARRCSQWYVLLKPFAFPRTNKPKVMVDVLTSNNRLYQGEVADYFLEPSGQLSGLLLKDFRRFKYQEFQEARKANKDPKPDDYWRDIPGTNLVIPAEKIENINIRYAFTEKALEDRARLLFSRMKVKLPSGMTVVITSPKQDHAESTQVQPDDAQAQARAAKPKP